MGFIPGIQGWYNIHKSINIIHHINKMKDKNHIIISIDAEKAFDKVQHPFMIKTLNNIGIEGPLLNIIKAIYVKLRARIIPSGQNLKAFPLRSGTRQGCPLSPLLFIIVIGLFRSRSHSNQTRDVKGIQIGKEEVKLSLFAHDMIVHIENLTDSTKKLLNLVNELSKQQGSKSLFRNQRHFCTPTMTYQKQKSGKIPICYSNKKIKYLGINLTKAIQTCTWRTIEH